jgi:hypothetical protein
MLMEMSKALKTPCATTSLTEGHCLVCHVMIFILGPFYFESEDHKAVTVRADHYKRMTEDMSTTGTNGQH